MLNKTKSILVVLTGPSGVGKTTLKKEFVKRYEEMKSSVSTTTRCPREGEADGIDYYFVSSDTFKKWINQNRFCEWAKVYGHHYGTRKDTIEQYIKEGYDVLLTLDTQGASKIRELYDNSISIFIMPPSTIELKNRLLKRCEKISEDIEKRLNLATKEMENCEEFDFVVVNENIEDSIQKISAIIAGEHKLQSKENRT